MTTYKVTFIRLSADFSTETLQARREWLDIFKVMKGKNLYSRIFYPARLSFRFSEETKALQTRKAKQIQYYWNSFAANTKGTSLKRKEKVITRNNKITNGKAYQ